MSEIAIKDLLDLSGKTAIVTGGAMGIGLGISARLAEAGTNVLIADINAENAERAKQTLAGQGYKVDAITTDVSKAADVEAMVQKKAYLYSVNKTKCLCVYVPHL